MDKNGRKILLIYDHYESPESTRNTIFQHLRVLEKSRFNHDITYYNAFDDVPNYVKIDKKSVNKPPQKLHFPYDAIILHYTFLGFRTIGHYFWKWKRKFDWIKEIDCLKIAIPQDEGNFTEILEEWLYELGVSVILSVHFRTDGPLYPSIRNNAKIYSCLPGYIDEESAIRISDKLLPIKNREYDIVYRARKLPISYGSAGILKSKIAEIIEPAAKNKGLNTNISTNYDDSIFGDSWLEFIASGKSVIGAEGGYSVIDWRGEIKGKAARLLKKHPNLDLEGLGVHMPLNWDEYKLFTITPRHFEAVTTKTCQLLVEGDYKGILLPDKHYIAIKRDFSNLNEVLEKICDTKYLQNIVEAAYSDLFLSGKYSYKAFAELLDHILNNQLNKNVESNSVNMKNDNNLKVIKVLERQLVAERHKNELLESNIQDYIQDHNINTTDFNNNILKWHNDMTELSNHMGTNIYEIKKNIEYLFEVFNILHKNLKRISLLFLLIGLVICCLLLWIILK